MAAMAVDDDLVAATVAYLCAKAACDTGQTNTTKKPKKKSTPRRWWVHPILKERENHGYSSSLIPRLKAIDGGKYTNFLRISAPLFEMLLCMVAPAIMKKDTCWRDAIPSETRLHLTLRFLATGENFKSLHYQFRVGQTTVGKIVQETCAALWTALSPIYVAFPKTSKDWEKIASEFAEKWQLPNCLGAIDGKHVRIQRPKNTNSLNCNYKRYFSKVLFAVADANYKFIYVDIGNYGSEGDSGILSKSKFGRKLFSGKLTLPTPSILPNSRLSFPYYFIGDQAFPLRKDLLRPYKRPTQSQIKEKIYNYRLCRARRVVENAFGMLANRFRVFRVELIVSEKTCDLVVAASIALHNFLLHEKCQKYCPPQFPDCENGITHAPRNGSWRDDTTPVMGLTPQSQQGSSNSARFIIENRDRLANYFATDGKVDWQDTAICKGYYMWIPYQNVGKQIEGTRFIAFKVPLKELICRTSSLNCESWFTPNHLLKQVKNLGLVIDLTNTCRFYNPEELKSRNVAYKKLFCMGNQIPSPEVVGEFFSSVDDFLARNPDTDSLVGVHCTHGVNRTGYLICRYLIEKYGHTSQSAIAAFNEARGHPIERPNYISHLDYVYKDSVRLSLEMEEKERRRRAERRSLEDYERRSRASDSRYRDRPRHSYDSHRDRNHDRARSRSPMRRRYPDDYESSRSSSRRRSDHSGYDDRRRSRESTSRQRRRY